VRPPDGPSGKPDGPLTFTAGFVTLAVAMGFAVNRGRSGEPPLMTPTSEVLRVGVPSEGIGPAGSAASRRGFFARRAGCDSNHDTTEGWAVKQRRGLVRAFLFFLVRHKMMCLLIGGALGTWLRYLVGRWFALHPWGQVFPYGTFFINVSGSLVLGFASVVIKERMPVEYGDLFLLVGVGFCGGYTTFSTFEWETFRLWQSGSKSLALVNVAGSVAAGYVGVLLGVKLAELLFPPG
jgi:CrcB protein